MSNIRLDKGYVAEFKDLRKNYGKKEALKGINLNIPRGKIVGLLGPNGSGKSTMIKILNGLLHPDSGEVLIEGMKPSIETKSLVSYLPERTYLNDWMKVKYRSRRKVENYVKGYKRKSSINTSNVKKGRTLYT